VLLELIHALSFLASMLSRGVPPTSPTLYHLRSGDWPARHYVVTMVFSLRRSSSTNGLTVSPTVGRVTAASRVGVSFALRSFTTATTFDRASTGSWFIVKRKVSSVVDSSRSCGTAISAEAASLMPAKVSVAERKKSVTCPVRWVTWSVISEDGITGAVCCGVLLFPHHKSNPATMRRASTGSAQRR